MNNVPSALSLRPSSDSLRIYRPPPPTDRNIMTYTMIITSLYTNTAASFKSSYNGRVVAGDNLTCSQMTRLGTPPTSTQ